MLACDRLRPRLRARSLWASPRRRSARCSRSCGTTTCSVGSFGSFILPAGAVGEFLPIVGIAIFLSANGKFLGLVSLVAMALVALL